MTKPLAENAALNKIISNAVEVITARRLSKDPPETDPYRRRCRKLADGVIAIAQELDGRITSLGAANRVLLDRAVSSKPGHKLVAAVQDAGLEIDAAAIIFERLKKTGADEPAILAAVERVISSLQKKSGPDDPAAAPSQPPPALPTPANAAVVPSDKPPAEGDAKNAATASPVRTPKGKA